LTEKQFGKVWSNIKITPENFRQGLFWNSNISDLHSTEGKPDLRKTLLTHDRNKFTIEKKQAQSSKSSQW
jgi:hypothetical protein